MIKLIGRASHGFKVTTRQAAAAISTRTADYASRCLNGVEVKSRAIEADIIMVKITPTMEFSAPNTFWNTLT